MELKVINDDSVGNDTGRPTADAVDVDNKKRKVMSVPKYMEEAELFLCPKLALLEHAAYNVQRDCQFTTLTPDTDVELRIRDLTSEEEVFCSFYCHSLLLKMASPVWTTALQDIEVDETAKRHIMELADVAPRTLAILLHYIYPIRGGGIDLSHLPDALLYDLLKLSHRYEVSAMLDRLNRHFREKEDFRAALILDQLAGGHHREAHWSRPMYEKLTIALAQLSNTCQMVNTPRQVLVLLPARVQTIVINSLLLFLCDKAVVSSDFDRAFQRMDGLNVAV